MATVNTTVLRGRRLRATVLDDCGNFPDPTTPDSVVVTKGFISVSMTTEVEEGTETLQKLADGSLCVNEKDPDQLKRITVEAEFCGVHPAILSVLTNAAQYQDANMDIIGTVESSTPITNTFALELWLGVTGSACSDDGDVSLGYVLLPFVNAGTIGDITVNGEDAITFTATGMFTKDGANWGEGPYDVFTVDGDPAKLPSPLQSNDHRLIVRVNAAAPDETDGLEPMPA